MIDANARRAPSPDNPPPETNAPHGAALASRMPESGETHDRAVSAAARHLPAPLVSNRTIEANPDRLAGLVRAGTSSGVAVPRSTGDVGSALAAPVAPRRQGLRSGEPERNGGQSAQPQRRGPKTVAGKARVGLNALTHGIASARLVVPGESATEWEGSRQAMMDALAPAGPVEMALAERRDGVGRARGDRRLASAARGRVRGGVDRGTAAPGDGQRPPAPASPRHRQDHSVRSASESAALPGPASVGGDAR